MIVLAMMITMGINEFNIMVVVLIVLKAHDHYRDITLTLCTALSSSL